MLNDTTDDDQPIQAGHPFHSHKPIQIHLSKQLARTRSAPFWGAGQAGKQGFSWRSSLLGHPCGINQRRRSQRTRTMETIEFEPVGE